MSCAGCASSGAPPVTTVRRSMPACAGCCGVAVAGSSDARGKALPVLWFGGTGTASTAAARAAVRWLVAQTKPNLVADLGARDDTATNPKPLALHNWAQLHTALASLSCSCELTQSHYCISTGHTCSSSVCSSILAAVNNAVLDLDSKCKESERSASRQGLPALATHPWKLSSC